MYCGHMSFKIERDLQKIIGGLAQENSRTLSGQVKFMLREYMKLTENKEYLDYVKKYNDEIKERINAS